MASGFIILEDGRGWAKRWALFDSTLELISNEVPIDKKSFQTFLRSHIGRADDYVDDGYGFYRTRDSEITIRHLDLRELHDSYRHLFWDCAQMAYTRIISKSRMSANEYVEDFGLHNLLDMHKRIMVGESPDKLSDFQMGFTMPPTGAQVGPGW